MEILIGLLLTCAAWAVVAAVLIARDLELRGIPVSYPWLRLFVLKYVHQYVVITRNETGRVGSLFYHYVVPLNLALALVVAMAFVA
jgi:hypothetical protein